MTTTTRTTKTTTTRPANGTADGDAQVVSVISRAEKVTEWEIEHLAARNYWWFWTSLDLYLHAFTLGIRTMCDYIYIHV